ncbi:hypothetical protein NPIL_348671 [Nephila pilipes]|uniref:Uncharacterized protein n=1 Tax=Nephila pilipes TaxID=299642 RepID=A0A8X6PJX5_NEPPI|nr:hypothetical protein NPIL_689741 [Nephila pilipes]GFU23200.1 hypothetical protein NPIL_348671 [Nephila pilipes]
MAGTKQTVKKNKEVSDSIINEDPTELEYDSDEDDLETRDTTEKDRNTDMCLQRALKEAQYSSIITNYLHAKFTGMVCLFERTISTKHKNYILHDKIHKYLIVKIELEEDLKRLICPKQCDFNRTAIEIEKYCYKQYETIHPPNVSPGTKIKASEKEDFKSPVKTTKQPRKEKFKITTSNQFEVLTKEKEDEPAPTPTLEKEKIPPVMMKINQNYILIIQEINRIASNTEAALTRDFIKLIPFCSGSHRIITSHLREEKIDFYLTNPPSKNHKISF